MTNAYISFEHISTQEIKTLNLTVHHYEHQKTGATHFHLESEYDENVFMVAFRTVPKDSTGVAHILEHTTLCGSQRFPVRDPFFMMLRRSLNTFMNAFTSSDWTAYPFATQNNKDYFNLLSVYLDSVFFPRLDKLDFAQEGHRLAFSDPNDSNSPLVYKGVVFNEMKGAMSSPTSQLWQSLTSALYPNTTYHFNSGGEPEEIPNLSHEQLLNFHQTHYHPSNAIFLTFGNISAETLQEKFEQEALSQFSRSDNMIAVDYEKPLKETKRLCKSYAVDEPDLQNKTHHVMGWLLGDNADPQKLLEAHFLSGILLDNSASPLRAALEQTDLGKAPSPICGLEDSNRQMTFVCGLEGSEVHQAEAVEKLILDTLEQVAKKGVSQEQQAAILHQIEFEQKEISGGYPYGLQLILHMLPACIHRGKPIEILDIEPHLAYLRNAIKDPTYVQNLVKTLLLDNPHRVRLSLEPSNTLSKEKVLEEKNKLDTIKQSLSKSAKEEIIRLSKTLDEYQNKENNSDLLPKVTPKDIPPYKPLRQSESYEKMIPIDYFSEGSNGIVYQTWITTLPNLDPKEKALLPLYIALFDELGAGEANYQTMQLQQAQFTGGITACTSWHSAINNNQEIYADFAINGKSLRHNQTKLTELMKTMLFDIRFDEKQRIQEIIQQIKASSERRVVQNGHSLAMIAACSKMSPIAAISHEENGLQSILNIRHWLTLSQNNPSELSEYLARIQKKLSAQGYRALMIGEADHKEAYLNTLDLIANDLQGTNDQIKLAPLHSKTQQVWTTTTQVNFCAKAYPTIPSTHPDAPILSVLSAFLRNGFLHTAIREKGGAYGGGASYESEIGAFRFYSYRDPRHIETLQDFDQSLVWLEETQHTQASLDEAILSIIANIDKPGSPAGEARKAYYQKRYGRTDDYRKNYREGILNTSIDDLKQVAQIYLKPENSSMAIITSQENLSELSALDLEHHEL